MTPIQSFWVRLHSSHVETWYLIRTSAAQYTGRTCILGFTLVLWEFGACPAVKSMGVCIPTPHVVTVFPDRFSDMRACQFYFDKRSSNALWWVLSPSSIESIDIFLFPSQIVWFWKIIWNAEGFQTKIRILESVPDFYWDSARWSNEEIIYPIIYGW